LDKGFSHYLVLLLENVTLQETSMTKLVAIFSNSNRILGDRDRIYAISQDLFSIPRK
jgi:hypothetical protein